MTAVHAERVLAIYQAGIAEGHATFETRAPAWEEFGRRERIAQHHGHWRDVLLLERRSPSVA